MKEAVKSNTRRSVIVSAATLAIAAMGFAGNAQARGNVFWSVGVGSPGVEVQVGNTYPVYVQPAPTYIVQQPGYVQSLPRYYRNAPQVVYVQPAYYYGRYKSHHRERHHEDDDD